MSGSFVVDLHVKVLDDRVIRRARAEGLDAIVYAPHFTPLPEIRERAARYSSDDLLVIPGREVFTGTWWDRKHVLALGLTDPVPDFVTLDAAMAAFERQDAVVLAPHPTFANVSMDDSTLRAYREQVHAVEVFNPKHLPTHNRRARSLAESLDLPEFASSYAHLTGSVGAARTVLSEPTETEAAVLDHLRDGRARRAAHADGWRRFRTTTLELAHLGWENTWQKFRRVAGSGREPTHPTHDRYEGRFDDAVAY